MTKSKFKLYEAAHCMELEWMIDQDVLTKSNNKIFDSRSIAETCPVPTLDGQQSITINCPQPNTGLLATKSAWQITSVDRSFVLDGMLGFLRTKWPYMQIKKRWTPLCEIPWPRNTFDVIEHSLDCTEAYDLISKHQHMTFIWRH